MPGAVRALLRRPLDRDAAIRIAVATSRRLQASYEELGLAAADVADATVLHPLEIDLEHKVALSGPGSETEVSATQDNLSLTSSPASAPSRARRCARPGRAHATVELVARVDASFHGGLDIEQWGYNASTPGPLLEGVVGDRVRVYVENRLPEATTLHWHGMFVPSGMDGAGGVTQHPIPPGKTFVYEFPLDDIGALVPGNMTMGQNGMAVMGGMALPRNSISMQGAPGPSGVIDMGGMFTLVKVRRRLAEDGAVDPGWHDHPAGSVSVEASADHLRRDRVGEPHRAKRRRPTHGG